jgi:hypothetical protein
MTAIIQNVAWPSMALANSLMRFEGLGLEKVHLSPKSAQEAALHMPVRPSSEPAVC